MEIGLNGVLFVGDCRDALREIPDECIQMCVTSPPYHGLRDYSADGQVGLEGSLDDYINALVGIFGEVRRVLRPDGTLWLNLGDRHEKNGNLCGMPWRVALALQADGWYLRSDIIWAKGVSGQKELIDQLRIALNDEDLDDAQAGRIIEKFDPYVGNPMPESVRNRPSNAHEHVFLMAKNKSYFYDEQAVKEDASMKPQKRNNDGRGEKSSGRPSHRRPKGSTNPGKRNLRNVWTIPTKGLKDAHFAVFPEALVVPCVSAGTSAYGCCKECGAPWERIVQRGNSEHHCCPGCGCGRGEKSGDQTKQDWSENWKGYGGFSGTAVDTGEFQPGCECESDDVSPCVVLDPFFGSGTVGVVCEKMGRRYIGIELNPEYAEIAKKRIDETIQL